MKKTILAVCLLVVLLPLAASAYSVKSGNSVYLGKEETITGNFYAAGANLTIEGKVDGDVICAGQSVNISGDVAGDVICAGQSVTINGKVGGNVRLIGETINLNGSVARNATLLGNTIIANNDANIGWDCLVMGNVLELRGKVGRDLYGRLDRANLTGSVDNNVNLNFDAANYGLLVVADTAKINGDLRYTAEKNAAIATNAQIKGQVNHAVPSLKKQTDFWPAWWWGNLIAIFSALVIGLVLISFWRAGVIKITDSMLKRVGASLGWGFLVLILTPPLAIILLITIIGIPLSLILVALWLIALYVSKILAGILIGRSLLNSLLPKHKDSLLLAMVVGIVISYLIFAIPFIGWIVSLLAMLWGLGGIALILKKT
ncbi:MAG: polymer-forming cytoskeletal protein [Patescibacteria group bacterium]|nr:polymer-forming cytoskeletal protein [Patescibacteria group bacterium]